mmetsp:Transcript_38027/g.94309  ORF Transcript_38027/g.94309 Transcript_38027/m.94309 type:complete len:1207 (+) Transcript_38027:104-3724(+)
MGQVQPDVERGSEQQHPVDRRPVWRDRARFLVASALLLVGTLALAARRSTLGEAPREASESLSSTLRVDGPVPESLVLMIKPADGTRLTTKQLLLAALVLQGEITSLLATLPHSAGVSRAATSLVDLCVRTYLPALEREGCDIASPLDLWSGSQEMVGRSPDVEHTLWEALHPFNGSALVNLGSTALTVPGTDYTRLVALPLVIRLDPLSPASAQRFWQDTVRERLPLLAARERLSVSWWSKLLEEAEAVMPFRSLHAGSHFPPAPPWATHEPGYRQSMPKGGLVDLFLDDVDWLFPRSFPLNVEVLFEVKSPLPPGSLHPSLIDQFDAISAITKALLGHTSVRVVARSWAQGLQGWAECTGSALPAAALPSPAEAGVSACKLRQFLKDDGQHFCAISAPPGITSQRSEVGGSVGGKRALAERMSLVSNGLPTPSSSLRSRGSRGSAAASSRRAHPQPAAARAGRPPQPQHACVDNDAVFANASMGQHTCADRAAQCDSSTDLAMAMIMHELCPATCGLCEGASAVTPGHAPHAHSAALSGGTAHHVGLHAPLSAKPAVACSDDDLAYAKLKPGHTCADAILHCNSGFGHFAVRHLCPAMCGICGGETGDDLGSEEDASSVDVELLLALPTGHATHAGHAGHIGRVHAPPTAASLPLSELPAGECLDDDAAYAKLKPGHTCADAILNCNSGFGHLAIHRLCAVTCGLCAVEESFADEPEPEDLRAQWPAMPIVRPGHDLAHASLPVAPTGLTGECLDNDTEMARLSLGHTCAEAASHCISGIGRPLVQKLCPVTCELCGREESAGDATYPADSDPIPPPSRAPHRAHAPVHTGHTHTELSAHPAPFSGECLDDDVAYAKLKPGHTCADAILHCNSGFGHFAVRHLCPAMCGICGGETGDDLGSEEDASSVDVELLLALPTGHATHAGHAGHIGRVHAPPTAASLPLSELPAGECLDDDAAYAKLKPGHTCADAILNCNSGFGHLAVRHLCPAMCGLCGGETDDDISSLADLQAAAPSTVRSSHPGSVSAAGGVSLHRGRSHASQSAECRDNDAALFKLVKHNCADAVSHCTSGSGRAVINTYCPFTCGLCADNAGHAALRGAAAVNDGRAVVAGGRLYERMGDVQFSATKVDGCPTRLDACDETGCALSSSRIVMSVDVPSASQSRPELGEVSQHLREELQALAERSIPAALRSVLSVHVHKTWYP